jgi:hypothetical protein
VNKRSSSGSKTCWDADEYFCKFHGEIVVMNQVVKPADPTPPTLEKKLALLQKLRDELGSGDTIRRLFFGDLEPIALQPGGADTVVHLYNKANDVTIAYCVSYDVFLAARPGRVTEFDPATIK